MLQNWHSTFTNVINTVNPLHHALTNNRTLHCCQNELQFDHFKLCSKIFNTNWLFLMYCKSLKYYLRCATRFHYGSFPHYIVKSFLLRFFTFSLILQMNKHTCNTDCQACKTYSPCICHVSLFSSKKSHPTHYKIVTYTVLHFKHTLPTKCFEMWKSQIFKK